MPRFTFFGRKRLRFYLALSFIILLAAALRWRGLGAMSTMLMYDEAYNAWDALLLYENAELTPFLKGNFGRESGFHYFLLPLLKTIGASAFTVHYAASVLGIMTVAAMVAFGKVLFGRNIGLWSALALAVTYIHIHYSHLGLRAISQPLVGLLAFTWLVRGQQTHKRRYWFIGGLLLGLLMYTYFSARLWILFAGVWMAGVWLTQRQNRQGASIAFLTTSAIAAPQLYFSVFYPSESFDRINQVAAFSVAQFIENCRLWWLAFTVQGDPNVALNLANRPLLDLPLLALALLGIVMALLTQRNQKAIFWILGLGIVSLLPSLLSESAPHFLRANGIVVPVSLLIGVGVGGAVQFASRIGPSSARMGQLLAASALLFAGYSAAIDFSLWLEQPAVLAASEQFIMAPIEAISQDSERADLPLYFSPLSTFHPNIMFSNYRQNARPVRGFANDVCTVVPDGDSVHVSVPAYQPSFTETMAQWGEVERVMVSAEMFNNAPLYEIVQVTSQLEQRLAPEKQLVEFGEQLRVRHLPLPNQVSPGDSFDVTLAFRALATQPNVYSAFMHLQSDPSPYKGGRVFAAADSWLCQPHPSTEWQPYETVLQTFTLHLPEDVDFGRYDIAIGIYESPAGARIPLVLPAPEPNNHVVIGSIEVVANLPAP